MKLCRSFMLLISSFTSDQDLSVLRTSCNYISRSLMVSLVYFVLRNPLKVVTQKFPWSFLRVQPYQIHFQHLIICSTHSWLFRHLSSLLNITSGHHFRRMLMVLITTIFTKTMVDEHKNYQRGHLIILILT